MLKRLALAVFALAIFASGAAAQTTNAPTTNGSVVIATGNTFQTLLTALAAQTLRRSLTIANNNATDSCWVYVGGGSATKGTSILLLPGGSYSRYFPYVPSDAIQATCATSSDTLYVDTQ